MMEYTIHKRTYTIKQAKSGWNIFKKVRPNLQGDKVDRFVMYVEGSYEDAHAELLEYAKNERRLLEAIFGISESE